MSRYRILAFVCGCTLAVLPAAEAQISPAVPVLTDSNGTLVGLLLDVGGGPVPNNVASVGIEVDGLSGLLVNTAFNTLNNSAVYYAANDCTGPTHVGYLGPPLVPAGQNFGGTFFQVAGDGDLYTMDHADRIADFAYGSFSLGGSCFPNANTIDVIPATLHRADFEDNFVPPYRIEAVPNQAVGGVVSVPAVGTVGLATLGGILLLLALVALRSRPA